MKTVSLFRFSLLLAAFFFLTPVPACLPEVQRTAPLLTVPAIPSRAEWKHFRILVWPWQTSVLEDYPLYEKLGLGGFQIDRGAGQEEKTGFSLIHDFPYYAGHVADKGFLYLTGENREAVTGRKNLLIRPRSLADPETIAQMKAHMDKNIRTAKKGLVLAYAFDDEISLGTFTNPADLDIHPLSLDWFREWLKKEYGTVNALNRQWDTAYRDFAEVMPQGFEQIRKNLAPGQPNQWNLSPWMDFRHFMDFQFAAVLAELTRHANGTDPKTPAGFAGGQAPSPWGGYDYAMLCRSVQWMEAYDIHETDEILRSFWNREQRPRMQTFFSSGDAKTDSWFLWYYLVHGNRAAIAWPEGWFHTEKGQISPHILNLRETFQEVQGEISQHILDPDTVSDPDPIGIYYSHPSVQASGVMDALVHGSTWHRRLTSLDNDNQSAGILRTVWCKTLEDLGYQYDFVSYLDVREKKTDLKQLFKVIVLPKIICLSDAEADALKDFVQNGGILITDYLCGIMDEHGKARSKGVLDDLFGIVRNESAGYLNGKGITEIDGEKYEKPFPERFTFFDNACVYGELTVFERGTDRVSKSEKSETGRCPDAARPSVLIQKNTGKGQTFYLNLCLLQYRSAARRFSAYGQQWRTILSEILQSAGLRPRVRVYENGKAMHMTETIFRKNKDDLYLALIKNPADTKQESPEQYGIQGIRGKEISVKIIFDRSVRLSRLPGSRELGEGREFTDTFTPWKASVYLIHPGE